MLGGMNGALRTRSTEALITAGRHTIRGYGELTARWRPDPEFLVIGAKRGGSTSFYFDLLQHPGMCPLFPRPDRLPKATETKGIHFFDSNYYRGERWYRSHLPSSFVRDRQQRRINGPVVTGEASPYYLFHPAAAKRAAGMLPEAKIIAVLRDPVMRTYSHWKERRRSNSEPLEFVDALAAEDDRIGDVEDRLRIDPRSHSYAHEQQSYARQSEYVTALEAWYAHYPAERILVLASEEYYRDPQASLDEAVQWLGLPSRPIASGTVRNAAVGDELEAEVRAKLAARFAPYNDRLEQLTGRTFPWS
jgi:hypothetical protein